MGAFAEEMQIELAEDRTEPVGVVDLFVSPSLTTRLR